MEENRAVRPHRRRTHHRPRDYRLGSGRPAVKSGPWTTARQRWRSDRIGWSDHDPSRARASRIARSSWGSSRQACPWGLIATSMSGSTPRFSIPWPMSSEVHLGLGCDGPVCERPSWPDTDDPAPRSGAAEGARSMLEDVGEGAGVGSGSFVGEGGDDRSRCVPHRTSIDTTAARATRCPHSSVPLRCVPLARPRSQQCHPSESLDTR